MRIPEAMRKSLEPEPVYIPAEGVEAFIVYQSCATQWSIGPDGKRKGLDYTAVLAVCGLHDCADPVTFGYIRALELGALAAHHGEALEPLLYD